MAVTSGPQCSLNLQHISMDVRVSMVHSRLYMLHMIDRELHKLGQGLQNAEAHAGQ